jgi:hypothetical protein
MADQHGEENMALTRRSVMEQMNALEGVFKAQIVGGPNSDPGEWAGSKFEDEDFPNSTPNGTDWDPKGSDRTPHRASNRGGGPRTRKSVHEASDAELERELRFRKSGAPNPQQADYEIMSTVPGITKAICTDCDGNALHKGLYCETCNNLGVLYHIDSEDPGVIEQTANMIKSIQNKWNIHKIDRDYWAKSQGVNTGGGVDEADTTPSDKKNMRQEIEDHTGEMVAKGEMVAEEMEDVAEDVADADEDDVEAIGKGVEACLKGIAFLARRQSALLKAGFIQAGMNRDMGVTVADMGQDVEWLVRSMQAITEGGSDQMGKSLNSGRSGGPARGPAAVGPGVQLQVLQKSGVNQAPGRGLQEYHDGDQGPLNGLDHNYSPETIKKAATYMGVHRKLNRQDALSVDTGLRPSEKVEKAIVAFLDANGGTVPPLGVAPNQGG